MTGAVASADLAALERDTFRLPLAHLPDWLAVTAERVEPGVNVLLDEIELAFTRLETSCTSDWTGLMEPLEQLNLRLGRVAGAITHMLSVKYSDALQSAWDTVRPRYVSLGNRMNQSTAVYKAMTTLRDSSEGKHLAAVRRRILDESIRSMERSGVHLTGEPKERFQVIQTRLAELSSAFSTNLVKAERSARVSFSTPEAIRGIPRPLLEMAAQTAREDGVVGATADAGPWHFVVNGVNYSIVTWADDPATREAFYRAFRNRGQGKELDNRPILEEILRLRQEQSQLVGFRNYVELSLDSKMAKHPDAVWALLNRLETAARPAAENELATLTRFARETAGNPRLQLAPWDVPYWAEKLEQAKFGYDNEALRSWFQLPIVIEGLFELTERLYGATFELVTDGSVPVWDPSVLFYEVRRRGKVIAGFFLDPCARPGEKRGGAWINIVVDRNRLLAPAGQSASLPVALMVMNARPPADEQPALLSLDEVRTLFHEFGHATQLLFTEVDEGSASGLNLVEWDAVELASQFNEYWMDHKPFLRKLSRNVSTGQPLDDTTAERIIEGANFMAGNATLRQLLFAKTDLRIHAECGLPGSNDDPAPSDLEKRVASETLVMPTLPEESQLPAFTHLFSGGYAAGYYSYKWAEVLAADAFAAFDEAGLDDEAAVQQVADRFRQSVLALGGSLPANEIYRQFRGRDATPDALLRKQGLFGESAAVNG
jgi:oligopeptidase A